MHNKLEKINIGGIFFDNVTMSEAIKIVEECIKNYNGKKTAFMHVANQDIINRVRSVNGLSLDYINKAYLTIPDGYSIVFASKILGTPLKERVTGPDFMYNFIKLSNTKGYKHFFLGAKEGVAQKMADIFLKQFPKVNITGIYSPPFGEFSAEENKKMITMINKAKPDVLWVSLGCPKQEKWILDNIDKINVPVSAGIGAAFDFHSGNVKRAPVLMQKMRLEWFHRLLQEPGRLWKRYFFGGFKFANTILKQKFSKK
jgi:N-acetylglucosaminyldiphosphoundecaprenol N-acetyl-beta-D-mannosaminyltransferase